MTVASIPSVFYEFAFNTDPNQGTIPPYWTDLSSRVQYGWKLERGRQYELDTNEAGVWQVELANTDGALDPGNAASPYAPNVLPYRPCRIRMVLGNNLLLPDQASGGEWSPLAPGPVPAPAGVGGAFGVSVAAVGGSAYQGTQVFAVAVPGTASTPQDLIAVPVQQVTAGTTYTFSLQAQAITSGQNPSVQIIIAWVNASGQQFSFINGSAPTLTGGAGSWTQLTATGTAPANAVAAVLRVSLFSAPAGANVVWFDGLQFESRGYATRWQMPWTQGTNLLPRNVATGTETMSVVTDQVSNWFTVSGATTLSQTSFLSAAPSGQTTAATWTIPSGSYPARPGLFAGSNPSNLAGPVVDCAQVTAGFTYTFSAYFSRTGTDPTVTVIAEILYFDKFGNSLSPAVSGTVTVPTSGWVRATVSGAAPAGAAWGRPFIFLNNSSLSGTETIYATGWQLEQAAAASTWADPGPATFLFTGLVERFPRTWSDLDSTYGTSKLQCVDATAALAQLPLPTPFVNEVLALGPNFFYQLNDPSGATSCVDTAGRRVAAPVENSPFGAGSVTFGNSVTSTTPSLAFVGTSGPVATFNNNSAGAGQQVQEAETFVSIHKTTTSPGPPTGGKWTRFIHFRALAVPATTSNAYELWSALPATIYSGNNISAVQFSVQRSAGGNGVVDMLVSDSAGNAVEYTGTANLCDGNWHQLAISMDGSSNVAFYVDGQPVAPNFGSTPLPGQQFGFTSDALGASIQIGANYYRAGHIGDLACAIEFPAVLTAAQVLTLYNSWRTASAGESSGSRYARVLRWIGWTGPTSIAAGSTSSMGPATDTANLAPLDALNVVAATENGDSYVSAAGVLTFTARSALYGVRTPQVIFGEGLPVGNAGEWPAEVGSIDFDPAHLANNTQVTQYQGSIYAGRDATSVQRYFGRLYQRTVNVSSGSEAQDAANYLLSQLKDPHQRANVIRLHPSAMPGLFPVVAQIDKNTRARLMKRPIGAPATQLDVFIQRIAWTWSALSDVFVEYQASPADLVNYWRLGALHTTLSAQAASGQANATINALPDAATNKLAQSLPSAQVLWFEPGTSRFEAVTVQTIPSTSVGYSTATLTMTGNFSFTHPLGAIVCEPLPTGYTDPTTWDASSVLGAAYAPILSGGASGTNTVTVGPMPDAVRNGLGQNWNVGDVVQLSAGGAGIAETATIASVATTYPGYTSCVITFTANLAHSHPAGDYVSDVMPATTINPSTWTAPTTRAAY